MTNSNLAEELGNDTKPKDLEATSPKDLKEIPPTDYEIGVRDRNGDLMAITSVMQADVNGFVVRKTGFPIDGFYKG